MDGINKLTHEDLFYTEEEALEWAEWERRTIETEIRKKATKEGLEQGIEQTTKKTILSMLENNLSLDIISKVTNKSIEEINKIKEQQ